ncbi:MAG: sulfurtransferase TusA family protein [Thermoprotei archaeon]
MEIGGCCFPDNLLYDSEGLTWVGVVGDSFTIGITQLQAYTIGMLSSILVKQQSTKVLRGGSVAFLETKKYAGNVRTPLSGIVEEVNPEIVGDPSLVNRDPYGRGWITKLKALNLEEEETSLLNAGEIHHAIERVIQGSGLRCFSVYPEYYVSGIGGECPETLKTLGDLLEAANPNTAVLLVTDNPRAEQDVPNWVTVRGYKILDIRTEQPLKYYVIAKHG